MTKSKRPLKKGPLVLSVSTGENILESECITDDSADGHHNRADIKTYTCNIARVGETNIHDFEQAFDSVSAKNIDHQDRRRSEFTPEFSIKEIAASQAFKKETRWLILDFLLSIFSIFCFLADLGSDIFVAVMHFRYRNIWWFGLTVSFIVLPSLIVTAFSVVWYTQARKTNEVKERTGRCVLRYILVALQLGPLVRYVEALVCIIRAIRASSRDERSSLEQLLKEKQWEETDSSLLRLLKCFLEAAPQLTLQFYIIVREGVQGHVILAIGQAISCVTSLCSLSWSLIAYHKNLRLTLTEKKKLSYLAMVPMFLWHFLTIGARIVCLGLFAAEFSHWVFVVIGCHWFFVATWILLQNTNFCENSIEELFFNLVVAVIYVFCFLNLLERHTRLRYTIYFTVVYAENTAMISTWYCLRPVRDDAWYVVPAMVAVLGMFFVGIFFQLVYYLSCHPNNGKDSENKILLCVSCSVLLRGARDDIIGARKAPTASNNDCIPFEPSRNV